MEPDLAGANAHLGWRLDALVEHELSADDEAVVRTHLAGCEGCAAEHRRLESTVGLVAGLGRVRAPEGFAARLLKRARSQRHGAGLRVLAEHKVPYEGVIVVLLVAAAAVLFMALAPKTWSNVLAHNTRPVAESHPR